MVCGRSGCSRQEEQTMPDRRGASRFVGFLIPVISLCLSGASMSYASPGPEPLQYEPPGDVDLPRNQPLQATVPSTRGMSLTLFGIGAMLVAGLGLGIHTQVQDRRRVQA